jgi:hypothetical protein
LSFGFGFERSKAWAGCDGSWAVIFVSVDGFAMKMGHPVLLVPDKPVVDSVIRNGSCMSR